MSASPKLGLTAKERDAGLTLHAPFTTGGGFGVLLVDELYLMVDLKVHRFEASLEGARASYTTVSLGAELGYRVFLWRGLFVQAALRYWPNVYTSLKGGAAQLGSFRHEAKDFGIFANFMLGWAFEP